MPGITNPAEPYFKDGIWGWDGSAWRKLPLLWGYSEPWSSVEKLTMPANGNYVRDIIAVPAGYVYKLEVASLYNYTGARGWTFISILLGGNDYFLAQKLAPAVYESTIFTGSVTLPPGYQVRLKQYTCLQDDVMYSMVQGYKMKIAE